MLCLKFKSFVKSVLTYVYVCAFNLGFLFRKGTSKDNIINLIYLLNKHMFKIQNTDPGVFYSKDIKSVLQVLKHININSIKRPKLISGLSNIHAIKKHIICIDDVYTPDMSTGNHVNDSDLIDWACSVANLDYSILKLTVMMKNNKSLLPFKEHIAIAVLYEDEHRELNDSRYLKICCLSNNDKVNGILKPNLHMLIKDIENVCDGEAIAWGLSFIKENDNNIKRKIISYGSGIPETFYTGDHLRTCFKISNR